MSFPEKSTNLVDLTQQLHLKAIPLHLKLSHFTKNIKFCI